MENLIASTRQWRFGQRGSESILIARSRLSAIKQKIKRVIGIPIAMPRYVFLRCKYWLKLKTIKKKKSINVAFQIVHASVWKLGYLYSLLEQNPRFYPYIVICPHSPSSEEEQKREFEECVALCDRRGYRFFETIQKGEAVSLDKTGMPRPDFLFIQNSYQRTLPQYKLSAWGDALPCYVSYFFTMNIHDRANYSKPFHKDLWRHFLESPWHESIAKKYKSWYEKNTYVSGYPGLDRFLLPESFTDPWRSVAVSATDKRKRIIYAPHHTISNGDAGLAYSTFEEHCWLILELAEKYSDRCIFAFKPHPLLYEKVVKNPQWGKSAADKYWQSWESLGNGLAIYGDYEDLFNTSDAMMHDCNSFLAEYLATGKPCLFLMADNAVGDRINRFGRGLLDAHYKAYKKQQIVDFIDSVVIDGSDPEKERREKVIQENLLYRGDSASKKIFDHMRLSACG
ncbi:CDP-glycerol glycerophosphotransferase family protein [Spiribacter vilamensis]|uniref:CDP-glycerol glycerophosphotransferase family protein n=1 Tax=Spiribacter vilamensis TaxID=531306 RepID=UPI0013EE97D8|nr:CDP-glycerol glycerophosphotransferase family protein [Spiribacter vilamensis]